MHTLSGRRFALGGTFVPTIRDIGVGISRIPRWAGATVRPWSVLQHALAGWDLVKQEIPDDIRLRFHMLHHDDDEMATGDIPKPFKTEQQMELEEKLRRWFYEAQFKQVYPTETEMELIHYVDRRLLAAEAACLIHPAARDDFDVPDSRAVDAVWNLIDITPNEAIARFEAASEEALSDRRMKARALR